LLFISIGSFDYRTNGNGLTVISWFDNRCVTLLTTFSSINPMNMVRRYDRKAKEFIEITQPLAVHTYNKYMGGVDLHDQFISSIKHHIRHLRWYIHIFHHTLTSIIVNCWIIHRQHNTNMLLRTFVATLSNEIVKKHENIVKQHISRCSMRSSSNIHKRLCFDNNVKHLPEWQDKRRRCCLCHDKKSFVNCSTCNVVLCLNDKRNCYKNYHE
jgi:hypothetical protein